MKKLLSIFLITALLITQTILSPALAVAETPELPETSETSEQSESPETPEQSEETQNTESQDEEESNDEEQDTQNTETETQTNENEEEEITTVETPDEPTAENSEEENNSEEDEETVAQATGINEDGQTGKDTEIDTGDADASGKIANVGNTNTAATPETNSAVGGIAIVNEENGQGSENTGDIAIIDEGDTNQINDADLQNSLRVDSNTGDNSASRNTGGDNTIETGDANTAGTIFNSVNTNVDGLAISEFNIAEDHNGDYVLDFGENCIAGCDGGINIENNQNGEESQNTGELDIISDSNTFQQNDATVLNDLILVANTGDNSASRNTGGDSTIKTGDATAVGSVLNFLNNNFAGNVVYGSVNIFGNLVGDIIIPEDYLAQLNLPEPEVNLQNSQNGSNSTNTAATNIEATDEYNQDNTALIQNNLDITATTGENKTSKNTGGDNSIKTGDVDVDANVVNIANTNVVGGNWWFVLVNEAGNWVGKIISLPGTTTTDNFALSGGQAHEEGSDTINITNNQNGTDSQNTGELNLEETNTTTQTNNARIANNIVFDVNTGGNSASKNTGGNNTIETGDANAMLNVVNFANNNFAGANVFLTVVNVFGSWIGDVITPGAEQPDEQLAQNNEQPARGGNENSNTNSSNSNTNSNANNNSSTNSTNEPQQTTIPSVLASSQALSPNTKVSSSTENNDSQDLALSNGQVLGAQDEATKVRINLAWALVLIPSYFITTTAAKKGLFAKLASLVLRR